MLTLPIKNKWFNMILSGEKKEEYREIKPYYMARFRNMMNVHPLVCDNTVIERLQKNKRDFFIEYNFEMVTAKIPHHLLQNVRFQLAMEKKNGEQNRCDDEISFSWDDYQKQGLK